MSEARYTWGGDQFLFVEISADMQLESYVLASGIAAALAERNLDGIEDICPANASLLVKFRPEDLAPATLEAAVREIEAELRQHEVTTMETRIVEVPVWYDDPYTGEVAQRFREGFHQRPEGNDLDYAAEVNGLADAAEFIRKHHESPWIVSMVGFVAGLPFLYQLVDRDEQLVVPKYLSPRTDTPALTIGHGGCFGAIYSVRGAGGYQMFGITPAPIFDAKQRLADFADFSVFFKPGDIVRYRSVDEAEYRRIEQSVADGTFAFKTVPFTFDLARSNSDRAAYNAEILEAIDAA